MGRLLGIVASDVTPFARWLFSPPRSLNALASAMPDGWGAAVFDRPTGEWIVERRLLGTRSDESFAAMSPRLRGTVMVAHLRARGDGADTGARTSHPLCRAGWVFAHEGSVDDVDFVAGAVSRQRNRERTDGSRGDLLLAFFLTRLDAAGGRDLDVVVRDAVDELIERRALSSSFVLSNGRRLYAFRAGPSLHLAEDAASTRAVLVASEPLNDELWHALEDRSLLRIGGDAGTDHDVVVLRGADPRARTEAFEEELPFTD